MQSLDRRLGDRATPIGEGLHPFDGAKMIAHVGLVAFADGELLAGVRRANFGQRESIALDGRRIVGRGESGRLAQVLKHGGIFGQDGDSLPGGLDPHEGINGGGRNANPTRSTLSWGLPQRPPAPPPAQNLFLPPPRHRRIDVSIHTRLRRQKSAIFARD